MRRHVAVSLGVRLPHDSSPFRRLLFRLLFRLIDWLRPFLFRFLGDARVLICDDPCFARQESVWESSQGRWAAVVETEDHGVEVSGWSRRQSERLEELSSVVENISLFLRHNYADEIEAGEHKDMGIDRVVIRYLARERRYAGKLPAGG